MNTQEIINKLQSYKNCVFRGENKHYGNVSSKLYRKHHDIIHDNFSVLEIQKDLIERARPHIRPDASDIEVLTELQHYGGQTALIDFTNNALIALFFACYGGFSKDGRIIVLKTPAVLPEYPIKDNDNSPYRIKPSGKSPGVIFQSSVFVQVATGYLKEGSEEDCYKVINIKQEHKKYFLAYLKQSFGIDTDTIYNDIHGFIQNKDNYTTVDTEVYKGNSCHHNKHYDQAIEHYDNAIKLNPDFAEAFYNRGNVYADKGEYDPAIADYTKAIALKPDDAEVFNHRGIAYAKKGEYNQTIVDFTKAIVDFTKAIADFTNAIALRPDYAEAFYNRGSAYAKHGEYDPAIADYTKAIALRSDFAEAVHNRGSAYADKGEYDLAIADFTEAIALKPDFSEAFYNRGSAYAKHGEYDPAIADFTKAIELTPDDAEAFYNRGLAYGSKGEYGLAIADYTKAIALKPDYAEAFYFRGIAYESKGKYDLAIADFNKAIALRSDYAEAFNNRGIAYESKGKYELTITDYTKAIALKPDYAEAFVNRGIAYYYSKGEHDLAIADFNQAIQLFTQQGKIDLANKIKLAFTTVKRSKIKNQSPKPHLKNAEQKGMTLKACERLSPLLRHTTARRRCAKVA